ncbi:hypothetical protein XHC_0022 [Xanthomonas hortorum pv. carotae str. M081]|nr:hypothetical protein XHC_0022 [Xanthomonas hortorum pv. carotae str. M081]
MLRDVTSGQRYGCRVIEVCGQMALQCQRTPIAPSAQRV